MTRKTALTPDQVRANFRQSGVTVTQWAKDRGYDRQAVYRVIGGRDKANFGTAYKIAVDLGMKVPDGSMQHSVASDQPTTRAAARNAQQRAVA